MVEKFASIPRQTVAPVGPVAVVTALIVSAAVLVTLPHSPVTRTVTECVPTDRLPVGTVRLGPLVPVGPPSRDHLESSGGGPLVGGGELGLAAPEVARAA